VSAAPRVRALLVAALLAGGACERVKVNIGRLAQGGSGGSGDACSELALPPGWNCGTGCFVDPAATGGATFFDGAPDGVAANKPAATYPLDGAMVPINLGPLTFQWRRGPGEMQTLFRIRLTRDVHSYDLYVPCVRPSAPPIPLAAEVCTYTPPEATWRAIVADSAGGELLVTISATDGKHGPVATSADLVLRFSPEAVRGGLYYFSSTLQGIYRLPFGARQPQAFVAPKTAATRFDCAGCHAVSRHGTVVAFAGEYSGFLTSAPASAPDQPTIAPPPAPMSDGHVPTLHPDGTLVLSSFGVGGLQGQVTVRDTSTGSVVATLDPAMLGLPERKVFFPDWSPSGLEIAATVATREESAWAVDDGSIVVFPYNGGRFGAAQVLVPATTSLFHYAPSWSPDGKWILFVSAPVGVDSKLNPDGLLRLVARTGGTIYDLGRATQRTGKKHSSWPRFAPVAQRQGKLLFFTFNSKIDYGDLLANRDEPTPYPQLWMAAVDLDRLGDPDPSTAPVWLPFQNPRDKNLQATWAEQLPCTGGANDPGCGLGAVCTAGACVPCGP
jgi:hypothetical protein